VTARPPRLTAFRITAIVFAIAVVFSLPALHGAGRELDYGANLARFLTRFWPPDFSVLGDILPALGETLQIAVMATLFATLASIPIAAAAASNIAPRPLALAARFALNAIRSIPSLIWALLAVAIVGANPLAGVIALGFYSVGYLGKFFSDAFESVDSGVSEALRAAGADAVQAFQFGIWPHARPIVWSQTLWMVEYNIRSASIVGYVGAGGIGTWLHTYQEFYQWDKFAAVLVCVLVVVIVLDATGEHIRRQFAPSS
jgi:phosphonate transport system permease protein